MLEAPSTWKLMENQQGKKSIVNFEKFTWKIENFSKQNTKNLQSKSFRLGGYKWRIRLYPLRKDVKHFSLYLMVADSLPAYGWTRNTYFKLVLINQLDANKSVVKETQQKFKGGHRTWGSSFLNNLSDLYDPKQGYLVNNTCIIEAHVCVSNIPPLNTIQHSKSSHDQETESSTSESETLTPVTLRSSGRTSEEEDSDLTLKDVIDLESLGSEEEAALAPLLEEACMWHPALITCQRNRSKRFKLWAFSSLGQVLRFLKTNTVKDMNEDGCNRLRVLWEELVKSSGFELSWLEPYVQSALGVKASLERTVEVNKLKENVVDVEIRMKKLKGELAAAEEEFEAARRALAVARKGFIEMDLNGELGYSMF